MGKEGKQQGKLDGMDMNFYISGVEILENIGCGICVCSKENKVLFANGKFRVFFNGRIDGERVRRLLSQGLVDGEEGSGKELYIEEDRKWFDVHRTQIRWMDQRLVELYTVYDITETKRYQQRIERQANNDFLTGLYNKIGRAHV